MFKSRAIEEKYNERLQRYVTTMNGDTPDRIPIRFLYQEVAARFAGLTNQQVACDYNLAFDCTRKMAEEMGNDAVMLNAIWSNYGVAKSASWKYLFCPGVDVEITSVNQFGEPVDEKDLFLQANEYDEFADDPTAFLFTKWFPRATTRLANIGEPVTLDHNVALVSGALAYANYMNAFGPAAAKLKYDAGIVSANSGMIKAPLDILADKFRGYIGTAIDTIERPNEVLKACEALMPHIIANALGSADPDKNVPITIWAHRGCVPFFTKKTFDTIFWPTLKPVFEEIISQGHQILFYGEGKWEAHYESLRELPTGSIIYHLDKGDPKKCADTFKGKFAISGGVNYDVLARGNEEDVRNHLKDLFSVMKPGGGYILDATALMLHDIDPKNVKTAIDYTMEHGAYSQGRNGFVRQYSQPQKIEQGKRVPNTVRSWEEESVNYRRLSGDIDLVKQKWQANDAAAYNYLWTSVLW
jgi:hypothetical protein